MVPNYVVLEEVKHIVGNRADGYTLLSLTKQGVIVRDLDAGGKYPSSFDTYKVVQPEQMIFCLFDIDETPRTVGLARNHGMITGAYDVFDVNSDVCDKRYLLYYYLIVDDGKHLRPYYASLRKTVTPTAFRHIKMPLPPLGEQQLIADYLDERCAAIDEVRRTIEDEIEALRRLRKATIHRAVTKGLDEGLPMRDSGIPWIGEIPEDWDTKRIKYLVDSRVSGAWGDLPELAERPIVCLRIADFDYEHLRFKDPATAHFTIRGYDQNTVLKCQLAKDDILVEKSGGGEKTPVGRAVMFDFDGVYLYANFMDRLRVIRDHVVPSYFLYVWSAMYACQVTRLYFNQTTGIQNLNFSQLLGTESFPLPPLTEQQRIADYLDERCAVIDSVIDTRAKQLERLDDYRRALVFAYVTGKREVPEHE